MKKWYLIKTKPRQEQKAKQNLENQHYQIYLPMLILRKKRRGIWLEVTEPLFPSYLFICIDDLTDNWSPIRSTKGVANFVRFGIDSKPSFVFEEIIENLKKSEYEQGLHKKDSSQFKKGEKVIISNDRFDNISAIFDNKSKQDRVFILLDMLGRQNRVEVSVNDIISKAY